MFIIKKENGGTCIELSVNGYFEIDFILTGEELYIYPCNPFENFTQQDNFDEYVTAMVYASIVTKSLLCLKTEQEISTFLENFEWEPFKNNFMSILENYNVS